MLVLSSLFSFPALSLYLRNLSIFCLFSCSSLYFLFRLSFSALREYLSFPCSLVSLCIYFRLSLLQGISDYFAAGDGSFGDLFRVCPIAAATGLLGLAAFFHTAYRIFFLIFSSCLHLRHSLLLFLFHFSFSLFFFFSFLFSSVSYRLYLFFVYYLLLLFSLIHCFLLYFLRSACYALYSPFSLMPLSASLPSSPSSPFPSLPPVRISPPVRRPPGRTSSGKRRKSRRPLSASQ